MIDGSQGDVVQTIRGLTDQAGVDVTFDAAGVPATASQVIPLTGELTGYLAAGRDRRGLPRPEPPPNLAAFIQSGF